MKKPPMTDLEKQRRVDMKAETRKLADDFDNVHVLEMGEFDDDPFQYTKELLTSICHATGRPVPTDEEIRKIVERAKNDIDKQL